MSTAMSHDLVKDRTVQISYRAAKDSFYVHRIPPSRVAERATGPRVPRSWPAHFAEENLDAMNTVVESWVSVDILVACAPVELGPELFSWQTGMTAIVIGDVNTGHTLDCAHRGQMLAALNERSLSVRGLPFSRTQTTGDVCFVDLVVLSVLQLSDVHFKSSPIEMQRADASYESFWMPSICRQHR